MRTCSSQKIINTYTYVVKLCKERVKVIKYTHSLMQTMKMHTIDRKVLLQDIGCTI